MTRWRNENPLLLYNIRQLLTLRGDSGPRRGGAMRELGIIEDATVLCSGGKITSIGKTRDAVKDPRVKRLNKKLVEIDCSGKIVLPGFVDSHTHPAFAAPRLFDFEKRISGAIYEEIAQAGGGIRSSVDAVRKIRRADLASKILTVFDAMAVHGTTAVEAKSGYGLSTEDEITSLAAIRDAANRWPGTAVPTFMGAHVVPREYDDRPEQYVRLIEQEMVPQVARRRLARFVDVFVEASAFNSKSAERIFTAAHEQKLGIRAHACQLTPASIAPLMRFRPASLDHLDHIDDREIPLLVASETVATLLPGANYFLGLTRYPPARKLIEAGVAVALASDYNPGTSPTLSMQMVLSLACTQMRMSPAEAITAATINGACALRLGNTKGSIEAGKDADLAIFDVSDYREVCYWFGANLCSAVILNGHLRTRDRLARPAYDI